MLWSDTNKFSLLSKKAGCDKGVTPYSATLTLLSLSVHTVSTRRHIWTPLQSIFFLSLHSPFCFSWRLANGPCLCISMAIAVPSCLSLPKTLALPCGSQGATPLPPSFIFFTLPFSSSLIPSVFSLTFFLLHPQSAGLVWTLIGITRQMRGGKMLASIVAKLESKCLPGT